MKKNLIFGLALTIVMAASCNKQIESPKIQQHSLSASIEQSVTKAGIYVDDNTNTAEIEWSEGEQISVFTEERTFAQYSLNGELSFVSTDPAAPTLGAIYPYNAGYNSSFVSGEQISKIILPAEYGSAEYDPTMPKSFCPMIASLEGSNLDFKYAAGMAMFAVSELPVGAAKVVLTTSGANITGEFAVAAPSEGNHGTISLGSGGSGNSVSINFASDESVLPDIQFFFPLPIGDYTGFIFDIKDASDASLTRITSTKAFSVERASIKCFAVEPVFQFVLDGETPISANEVSFAYGETKTLTFAAKGVKNIVAPVLPEGWTVDASAIASGRITITAPATGAYSAPMSLTGTSYAGTSVTSAPLQIRILGINNLSELLAFREVYGATVNDPVLSGHEKYMRGGELCLNADIALGQSEVASKAYFIKYLVLPLNGCGYTLSVDFNTTAGIGAIFQYIKGVSVHDINLAGSITNKPSGKSTCAGLAATVLNGATFSNITSDIDITYNADAVSASLVGGMIGNVGDAAEVTMSNCEYSGTMTINAPVNKVGGLMAQSSSSNASTLNSFTDCVFSGDLVYSQSIAATGQIRLGGIVGDAARIVECTRCSFTGSMTFNCNDKTFVGKAGGYGIGGIIGRNTAQTDAVTNMKLTLTDCTSTGTITINDAPEADFKGITTLAGKETQNNYGLTIGQIPTGADDVELEISGCTETGSITFVD